MSSPTHNERAPLTPTGGSYPLPAQSTIQVDPAVLARTMQILSNQMAANQRPQPPAPPIANAAIQQSLSLPEGEYVGDVKDGVPDGRGTLTYHPGSERSSYEGTWVKGKFHGRGILKFSNGTIYQGQWENGLLHGNGIQQFENGSKYEGNFVKGKSEGEGTMRYADGGSYTGKWKNDLKHGQGTYTWADGSKYVGEWKEGKKNGKGKETEANYDYYDGEWQDGKKHGKGVELTDNHSKNGIWRQGQFWSGTWSYFGVGYSKGTQIDGVSVSEPSYCTIL